MLEVSLTRTLTRQDRHTAASRPPKPDWAIGRAHYFLHIHSPVLQCTINIASTDTRGGKIADPDKIIRSIKTPWAEEVLRPRNWLGYEINRKEEWLHCMKICGLIPAQQVMAARIRQHHSFRGEGQANSYATAQRYAAYHSHNAGAKQGRPHGRVLMQPRGSYKKGESEHKHKVCRSE